eukprot:TRINITY_DN1572_c0_g1_i1.p3 TRINITY_DN1572_c0_g1~~TRINITY_DN1572_c0_g1_i1.p3  ORF type:complete len:111 (-),score=3.24 TRINITY_DN1572_c0_g1_i1:185-517(-)
MIRRPPRSTQSRSSAASDVYKRQTLDTTRNTLHIYYPRNDVNNHPIFSLLSFSTIHTQSHSGTTTTLSTKRYTRCKNDVHCTQTIHCSPFTIPQFYMLLCTFVSVPFFRP